MATAEPKDAVQSEAEAPVDGAPAPAKRSKLKLYAAAGAVVTLCLTGGGYFAMPMALAMFAPAETSSEGHEAAASEENAGGGGHGGTGSTASPQALPVVRLVQPNAAASDYQIVSIFEGEAFLATGKSVIRVKVGSSAPGLGDILAIEASDTGGIVTGSLATLKTS